MNTSSHPHIFVKSVVLPTVCIDYNRTYYYETHYLYNTITAYIILSIFKYYTSSKMCSRSSPASSDTHCCLVRCTETGLLYEVRSFMIDDTVLVTTCNKFRWHVFCLARLGSLISKISVLILVMYILITPSIIILAGICGLYVWWSAGLSPSHRPRRQEKGPIVPSGHQETNLF